MHKLIREIADEDREHDPYGAGTAALWAACEALTLEGGRVPPEAGYRPGFSGPDPSDDNVKTILAGLYPRQFPGFWVEGYVPNLRLSDVEYAARILSRYLNWVELAGRSY